MWMFYSTIVVHFMESLIYTVGGFPASRGKREIRMRENSRGNYNAGNAGKPRTAIQGGDYVLGHLNT